ncbi:uncharacterized protein [Lepisosteus oculatus]|uniref:uncharacterized protein n=1 Tax=Lepisosteus oculatus TaxID=7918 RepID=UPI0007401B51|nr:PREDICTED: uncharacterized protein LOC107078502 isoform X1 [Lepisosteus oculatus]XP_015211801.1 PREDICTED: uncharacterized protein LOC107078502 isoform X2 [Lepisosteus oculatus]
MFAKMSWQMGSESMDTFFSYLNTMQTRSLQLTKEVLEERNRLEVTVEGLQPKIKVGLTTLSELEQTQEALELHKHCIEQNKNFEYEVEVTEAVKEDISETGNYITNCQVCHTTCHYPCQIPNDDGKKGCWAMDWKGNCTICPGKCVWNVNFNQKYKWEHKIRKEKRTYEDLKKQFEDAKGKKMTAKEVVKQLQKKYEDVQKEVLKLTEKLSRTLKCLKEIALRPDPLTTPDYIDLMILAEEHEAKPGYLDRIRELQRVREGAVIVQKVASGESLLPQEEKTWTEWVKDGASDFKKSKRYDSLKAYFTNEN